jgi:DNA-binding CsgD family transcriptional regulator
LLPPALVQLAITRLCQGELTAADRLVHDLEAGDASTPSEPSRQVAMLLAAYRGLEAEARQLIGDAERNLTFEARGLGAVIVRFAGLALNNGLGRYGDALRQGCGLLADPEPVARPLWALPELIEAGARAGANDVAADAMCRLTERAEISGTDWALGLEARSRALLSEGSEAEALYREAIARLGGHASRLDLARAHLLYGEWLRRAGRRIDARVQLRVAFGMLSDMGVGAFADRARKELRATGETARKRTFETQDELTAQELQVARLASDGLSNPEIGARLFLSPRTIEWHMRKVFRKLDVSSRFALRDALPAEAAISASLLAGCSSWRAATCRRHIDEEECTRTPPERAKRPRRSRRGLP